MTVMRRVSATNSNLNVFLKVLYEFLVLVGHTVTLYELYKFFKKHGPLIIKILFLTCVGFSIFIVTLGFEFLKTKSPKKFRTIFDLHKVFKSELIREAVTPFLFVLLTL